MGHRINVWIQRLLAPLGAILAWLLWRLGFGVLQIVCIVLLAVIVALFTAVVLDPGPKAKEVFSRFRNHTN